MEKFEAPFLYGGTFYPNTASNYIISIILRCFMIINDLLAPLSLFFHEFQQNSQFLRTISNDPDLGRLRISLLYKNVAILIYLF